MAEPSSVHNSHQFLRCWSIENCEWWSYARITNRRNHPIRNWKIPSATRTFAIHLICQSKINNFRISLTTSIHIVVGNRGKQWVFRVERTFVANICRSASPPIAINDSNDIPLSLKNSTKCSKMLAADADVQCKKPNKSSPGCLMCSITLSFFHTPHSSRFLYHVQILNWFPTKMEAQ